jgi:hypothetical protein
MRTTIDIPEAIHARAKALAHDRGISLSAALGEIVTEYFAPRDQQPQSEAETSPITGLPVRHIGRVLTSEDIASLWDDE